MVLVGVVLRRPSRVRREAVVDELPREVGRWRGASRGEEARAGVARRRKRRRHRGRRCGSEGWHFYASRLIAASQERLQIMFSRV